MKKNFELNLPVLKHGDDLDFFLSAGVGDAHALLQLAEQFEESARRCRRAASVAAEGDLRIDKAEDFYVFVTGNEDRLQALEKDSVLLSFAMEEEESCQEQFCFDTEPASNSVG